MKETTTNESESSAFLEAEAAEELSLRIALKRTRLEKAAESPSRSRFGWLSYVLVGGALLFFQKQIEHQVWLVAVALLIEIKSSSAAVHSRIDAILELEGLGTRD